MRRALVLLLLAGLLAAQAARADAGETVLAVAGQAFALMAGAPGTVDGVDRAAAGLGQAALGAATNATLSAIGQAAQLQAQARASAFVAIGSSTEYVDGAPCGDVKALVELDKKPVEPRLVLVLTPGNDTQRCPAQTLQWRSTQLTGDWEHGWDGAYIFTSTLHRIHIGPYGDGNHVAMHWTAWKGREKVGEWTGFLVNLA